ncbi:MAG: hypothetical protein OHK0022_19240 [Roseiflexaceae bacterium]
MTTTSSGRLLISHITLRGPELRQTYTLVAREPGLTYADLAERCLAWAEGAAFGLEEAPLRESLSFLAGAGMIEQSGQGARRRLRATPPLPNADFALLLLHHLWTRRDIRQRALLLIYQQLAAEPLRSIELREARQRMEAGPHGSLFAWTGEKLTFWSQLMEYTGLVRRLSAGTVVCLPREKLVLRALRATAESVSRVHGLAELLDRIDQRFFACFTARSQVNSGLAQTLVALHRAGYIRLSHSADAARSLSLGDWRVSEVTIGPVEAPE